MANYMAQAQAAARRYFGNARDQQIFLRQMKQEADFTDATSPAGAQGPAQIMPATAQAWGVKDVHDPTQAYDAAAKHVKQYLDQYGGSWSKALTAYNAGPGRVGGPLPAETQNYIKTILGDAGSQATAAQNGKSSPSARTTTTIGVDQAAYDQARKRSLVGQLLARRHGTKGILFTSGLLSTQTPTPADFQTIQQVSVPGDAVTAPGTANDQIRRAIERANAIDKQHLPYQWGGGHQAKVANVSKTNPLDCSGAVSAVLGIDPRVASQFKSWGKPGASGKGITVYAKDDHVLMEINGHFFGTSHANPGGGAGWIPRSALSSSYLSQFTARHM